MKVNKLKLNTVKFSEMLSRALKCASNNKNMPLTSMIGITLRDNTLYLHTTDMTNHLIIKQDNIEGDDFDIAVDLDVFSKLIPRITSEFIELSIKDNLLKIKGNGEYTIELRLDDEGNLIRFPDIEFNQDTQDTVASMFTINSTAIDMILANNKPSLDKEDAIYGNYYVGDRVVSSDSIILCAYDNKLFDYQDVLVSRELMDLLGTFIEDEINVLVLITHTGKITFTTDTTVLTGDVSDSVEDYNIEMINKWLDTSFDATCTLPKQAIINTLERIALFINEFDNRAVKLYFNDSKVQISSKQSSGVENIKYLDCEDAVDYECIVDVDLLLQQIKSVRSDKVTIEYGNDTCLKITEDYVIKLVSTMIE